MAGRGQRGVSVLELVVVLSIVATMFTIIWVVGPLGRRLALHAAAVTLVGDLRAVQARAIAERNPARSHGIAFTVPADRYVTIIREGTRRYPVRETRLPPAVRVTYARFGGGSPTTAMFAGVSLFGAPSGAGTVTLRAGASFLCVRVLPATGRIRVANSGCP